MRSSQSAQQRQEAQLAQLLDALDGVEITSGERRTLEWLAGWEVNTIENLAALFAKARATLYDGCEWYPHPVGEPVPEWLL
jgi:hypothetical protein